MDVLHLLCCHSLCDSINGQSTHCPRQHEKLARDAAVAIAAIKKRKANTSTDTADTFAEIMAKVAMHKRATTNVAEFMVIAGPRAALTAKGVINVKIKSGKNKLASAARMSWRHLLR